MLDQRPTEKGLACAASDDRLWTLDFTGLTLTGDTWSAVVFRASTPHATAATLTATVADADTLTLAYNGGDLTPGTYRWRLVNVTDNYTLLAGPFIAGRPGETAPDDTDTTETVSVLGGTASVTVNLGVAANLSIGSVTTVSPGGSATASITGTAPSQVLNLGIPTGATGATGPAGAGVATTLWLPSTVGNFVSCPDSAATSPTTEFEVFARLAADDWTPSATSYLALKGDIASARCFRVYVIADGRPGFSVSANGSAWAQDTTIGSALGFTDSQFRWINFQWRDNDGTGKQLVTVRTAVDTGSNDIPTSWTTHGTRNSDTSTGGLFDTTGLFANGNASLSALQGRWSRFVLRTTIGGANAADFRADAPISPRYRDSLGNLWTINGSAWAHMTMP